jgi:hypothetical protein
MPLTFTRAHLLFTHFSYNTPKGENNLLYSTMHWDNFGFDGPAPSTYTYNYPALSKGFFEGNSIPFSIPIPDTITGATAVRLIFIQNGGGDWQLNYSPSDTVLVNGAVVTIPNPLNSAAAGFGAVTGGGILSGMHALLVFFLFSLFPQISTLSRPLSLFSRRSLFVAPTLLSSE